MHVNNASEDMQSHFENIYVIFQTVGRLDILVADPRDSEPSCVPDGVQKSVYLHSFTQTKRPKFHVHVMMLQFF